MRLIDIAKKLKVSHTTVSRALNPQKQHLISAEVRERVLELARELKFVPNRAARDLVTGRSQTVGVLLPTMFNSLFFNEQLARTLDGIYDVLGKSPTYGCRLIILPQADALEKLDHEALRTGVDGLLISAQYDHFAKQSPYVPSALMSRWKKPLVFINLVPKKLEKLNVVSFDNFLAAKQGVTYLIQKGHRDIGLIYGQDDLLDSQERMRGYQQALSDHRLTFRPAFLTRGNYTTEGGYQAALTLFNAKGPKPTAVFCTNDEMAMGAIRALRTLGIACPKDVAVMGFDGLETGNYVEPRLTTVQQPSREIARQGTELLLELIEGNLKQPVQRMVPTDVVVRDSV